MYSVENGHNINLKNIQTRYPKCQFPALRRSEILNIPEDQVYAISTNSQMPDGTSQTAVNMVTNWNVPSLPQYIGSQVVYFWPGFKSEHPVMGYPVLQPVLQYGQQDESWYLQSWFVWGNEGVVYTGPPVSVNPGEIIDSYMQLQSNGNWICYGNSSSGSQSLLTVTPGQTSNTVYQYAMLVLETIMPSEDCSYYPTNGNSGVTFTDVSVNGKSVSWNDDVTMTQCSQKINDQSTTVQFTWTN